MATTCGWASIDERGKASGGQAGNQTGKELKTGNYYQFKQTVVYRFINRALAKRYAKKIKEACKNMAIGYDQYQRTTFYTQLKAKEFDVTAITTPCECDCSTLVAGCLRAVGVDVPYDFRTATLDSFLMKSGEFEKLTASKYLTSGDYLLTGDIINAPGHHVITALEDGTKAIDQLPSTGLTDRQEFVEGLIIALNFDYQLALRMRYELDSELVSAIKAHNIKYSKKYSYTAQHIQKCLKKLGYTDDRGKVLEIDGYFQTHSVAALKKLQSALGIEADGICGSGTIKAILSIL